MTTLKMVLVAFSVSAAFALSACGVADGDERGACYPNDTCNGSLTCASGLCVSSSPDGGGEGEGEEEASPAQRALAEVNVIRASVGVAPAASVAALEDAAQAHAEYLTQHFDPAGLNPHFEDPSLPGFTGQDPGVRMNAAGYSGAPMSEILTFIGNPELAVREWRDTVFHRFPLIHPDALEIGYGGVSGDDGALAVDVIDFGRGEGAPAVVIYPPDGAVAVPRSWNGFEFPQPTPPPNGFPSGPVVTITFDDGTLSLIDRHEVFDEDGNAVPHMFLSPSTPNLGPSMGNSFALYPNAPVAAGATLRVVFAGTVGFNPFEREWTFTTCTDCP